MENIEVVKADYIGDYRINLVFNDGTQKMVDLSDEIRTYPAFRILADKKKFAAFRLSDTLEWCNDIDIAPEYLYYKA
ncbi:MAG: DUF2442 domain-containing protein [Bacteroides sp.]|nr:DUF2442 domain-containing protein [Bacteroides sp.]MCM1085392.1 DUF2442 domain-containing protein [Bacteroides sp.]